MAEMGVSQFRQVLEAWGGVATLAEVKQEFTKRFSMDFDDKWRQIHFGNGDLGHMRKNKKFGQVITYTHCNDFFFRRRPTGEPPAVAKRPVEMKKRGAKTPGEQQMRTALAACGGMATQPELEKKFKEMHKVKFDKDWWKSHFQANKLSKLAENADFSSFVSAGIEKGTWIFRLLPEWNTQGLWQLMCAVASFPDGFCSCRQLRTAFSERLGLTFDTKWMRLHFGVDNLDSLASLVASKIRIWPKNDAKQEWYFQERVDDRADAGLSQLSEALEAIGGAATLDELEAKFQSKFSSGCHLSWMNLMFDVDSYEKLSDILDFQLSVEVVSNPGLVFRLRLQEPLHSEMTDTVTKGRLEILAVFDALDGECTVDELAREYGRQFHESLFAQKYFKRIRGLAEFLGQEVIIERKADPSTLVLVNKEYEGRRRMIRVLKAVGDCCSVEELDRSYLEVLHSSWADEMKTYFGVGSLDKVLPKLSNKVGIIRKKKKKYFILKPDFSAIRKLDGKVIKLPTEYKDLFNQKCAFLAKNIEDALSRLGDQPTLKPLCGHFSSLGGDHQALAVLLKETSPKILQLMVPKLAPLFERIKAKKPKKPQDRSHSPGGLGGSPIRDAVISKAGRSKQAKARISHDSQSSKSSGGGGGVTSDSGLGLSSEADSTSGTEVSRGYARVAENRTDSRVTPTQAKEGVLRVIRCLLHLNNPWSNEDELKAMYKAIFGVPLDEAEMERLFGVRSIACAARFLRYYVSISEFPVYDMKEEDLLVIERIPAEMRDWEDIYEGEENEMVSSGKSRLLEALDACPGGRATFEELKTSYHEIHGVALDEEELQKHFGGLTSMAQFISFDNELHVTVVTRERKVLVGNEVQLEVLCDEVPLELYGSAGACDFPST